MIVGIHDRKGANLPEIIDADNRAGLLPSFDQRRQKQARQDADDGDDHEQLNQRKG